jgi:hypothetical protein
MSFLENGLISSLMNLYETGNTIASIYARNYLISSGLLVYQEPIHENESLKNLPLVEQTSHNISLAIGTLHSVIPCSPGASFELNFRSATLCFDFQPVLYLGLHQLHSVT